MSARVSSGESFNLPCAAIKPTSSVEPTKHGAVPVLWMLICQLEVMRRLRSLEKRPRRVRNQSRPPGLSAQQRQRGCSASFMNRPAVEAAPGTSFRSNLRSRSRGKPPHSLPAWDSCVRRLVRSSLVESCLSLRPPTPIGCRRGRLFPAARSCALARPRRAVGGQKWNRVHAALE
jgi:hypothetical protein